MKGIPPGLNGVIGLRVPNHVGLENKLEFDSAIKREQKIVLEMGYKTDNAILIFVKVIFNNV